MASEGLQLSIEHFSSRRNHQAVSRHRGQEIDRMLRLRVSKDYMLERYCYFSQHLSNGLLELKGADFKVQQPMQTEKPFELAS